MKIINKKVCNFYKDIVALMRKPVMSILPGHLSFFLLLSLVPILLLIGVVANTLSISFDFIIDFLKMSLPAGTSKLILPLFTGNALNINITFLLLSAICLSSKGNMAVINAACHIYNVNKRPLRDIVKSIVITLLLLCLFIFIILILVIGSKLLELIKSIEEINFISQSLIDFYNFSKWPLSILVVFFSIKFIYILAPNKKISTKSVNKGTIFSTISIVFITYLYSYYINRFSTYDEYYGGASNLIVFMLWIYLISYIFVLGMSINSIEEKSENIKNS